MLSTETPSVDFGAAVPAVTAVEFGPGVD